MNESRWLYAEQCWDCERYHWTVKKIQRYLKIAMKENAVETYAELKSKYLSLKALLNVIGVNLIDIDIIKE